MGNCHEGPGGKIFEFTGERVSALLGTSGRASAVSRAAERPAIFAATVVLVVRLLRG